MIFKLTENIPNLYRAIKNTDCLTRKALGNWISEEYNNLPKDILLTKYESEIPNACLKLMYIYVNKCLFDLDNFEYNTISNKEMMRAIIVSIDSFVRSPSKLSEWYVILFEEMGLQEYYSVEFTQNDYEDLEIDIDNFVIQILKWNINPTYFGIFIEQVISYILGGYIQNINTSFDKIDLFKANMLFSKITKNINWYENFYYNNNCKSVYHYFAFSSLILNFEEFSDSYEILIERLNTDFIQKEIEKYSEKLYTNQKIIELFDLNHRIEYQKEVQQSNIHGYIDILTKSSIIDIKAYSNSLKNINEISPIINQWYFQIYLYDCCLDRDEELKNYIVFNPITNIIRIWKSVEI